MLSRWVTLWLIRYKSPLQSLSNSWPPYLIKFKGYPTGSIGGNRLNLPVLLSPSHTTFPFSNIQPNLQKCRYQLFPHWPWFGLIVPAFLVQNSILLYVGRNVEHRMEKCFIIAMMEDFSMAMHFKRHWSLWFQSVWLLSRGWHFGSWFTSSGGLHGSSHCIVSHGF